MSKGVSTHIVKLLIVMVLILLVLVLIFYKEIDIIRRVVGI